MTRHIWSSSLQMSPQISNLKMKRTTFLNTCAQVRRECGFTHGGTTSRRGGQSIFLIKLVLAARIWSVATEGHMPSHSQVGLHVEWPSLDEFVLLYFTRGVRVLRCGCRGQRTTSSASPHLPPRLVFHRLSLVLHIRC